MTTLVYHNGALGDFITIFPLLKLLKNRTEEQICLLGKPHLGQLAKAANLIDEIFDVNSRSFISLFSEHLNTQIAELLCSFDRFVIFSDHNSPLVKNISSVTEAEILLQSPFPFDNVHIADYHLALLKEFQSIDNLTCMDFTIPQSEENKMQNFFNTKQTIAICPGSGSPVKNWPLSNFMDLSIALKRLGYNVIWICGPSEHDFKFPINETVIRDLSLLAITALLKKCFFYIGNDSGITHLAAVTGCNTIALFGASNPQVWSPCGKKVTVLYKKQPCSPCHLNESNNRNCNHECMNCILVEDVLDELKLICMKIP